MACVKRIKEIERECQGFWEREKIFESEPDSNRKKFFVTFPMPYLNGKLHCGHAFTLIKAEISAAYHRKKGYNVLYPQAFHASGTPIPACAKLVAQHDAAQLRAMEEMKIPAAEIPKFADPRHWIETFEPLCKKAMQKIGCSIDWRRSFVTTDLNPHFSSFVDWQFWKLNKLGLLDKNEKLIIYSVIDRQPCSDHDRREGEGVKPSRCLLEEARWHHMTFLRPKSGLYSEFVRGVGNGENGHLWIPMEMVDAFVHQNILADTIDTRSRRQIDSFGDLQWKDSTVEFWQPEKDVISRSGEKCIVARIPQWCINYEEEDWKQSTLNSLDSGIAKSPELEVLLKTAIRNIYEWGCSRTRGMGTKLFLDREFLIDSLSDSTIYPAFYTVAHRLKNMISSPEIWDSILCGSPCPEDSEIVKTLREEFLYWYPLDLRVSGKDLINNHLTFCQYQHVAIWDKSMSPRSYWCNGHLLLNAQKMSKSTGNFLTMNDALNNWGADTLRLLLASAGDTMDDANFDQTEAEATVQTLVHEFDWMRRNWTHDIKHKYRHGGMNVIDKGFIAIIRNLCVRADAAYEHMRYRDAVQTAWYGMLNARDDYRSICGSIGMHSECVEEFIHTLIQVCSPIIPHLCEDLWKNSMNEPSSILLEEFPVRHEITHEIETRIIAESSYLIALIRRIKSSKRQIDCIDHGVKIRIELAHTDSSITTAQWKKHVMDWVAAGKNDSQSMVVEYLKTHEGDLAKSKRLMIPFFKWINSRFDKRLMDEVSLVNGNLHLICVLSDVAIDDVEVTVSDRRMYEKPVVMLVK